MIDLILRVIVEVSAKNINYSRSRGQNYEQTGSH